MVIVDMDMPQGCGECILLQTDEDFYGDWIDFCPFDRTYNIIPDIDERAEWCPLREIKDE